MRSWNPFYTNFMLTRKLRQKFSSIKKPKLFKDVEKILNIKNKLKTKIIQPQTGEKFRHIQLAEKNAGENIKLKKASLESHHEALKKLMKLFNLNEVPKRIEAYDNSHTFGKESVGVMIVVDGEGLSPKNYRKYNIRYDDKKTDPAGVDDYYMMKEVLSRRLKTKKGKEEIIMPNIIMVDGGRGQYNAVAKVLKDRHQDKISLMSVSKGKERNAGREIIHLNNRNLKFATQRSTLIFYTTDT